MNGMQKLGLASAVVALALLVSMRSGIAELAGPTENKGLTAKLLAAVDLGPQFAAMAGYQLRMRMVTLEPGGVLAVHDHKDRPNTDYVLQGAIVDHRASGDKEYRAGTSFYEDKDTVHWVDNKGTTPAVVIAADIVKQ